MKFTVTRVVEVEMYHIKLGLAWIAIMKNAMVICVVAAGIKLYKLGPCMEILVNAFTIGLLRARSQCMSCQSGFAGQSWKISRRLGFSEHSWSMS